MECSSVSNDVAEQVAFPSASTVPDSKTSVQPTFGGSVVATVKLASQKD